MPAFRKQRFRETCAQCPEFAAKRCKRCLTPFCAEHKPRRRRRCDECETEFERANAADEDEPSVAAKVSKASAIVGGVSLLVGVPLGLLMAATGVGAGVVVAGVSVLASGLSTATTFAAHNLSQAEAVARAKLRKKFRKRARRKFLRESKPRARLTAGDPVTD